MKEVPELFADLTMALEDLHGITVEGQHPSHSPDMQEVLVESVASGMEAAFRIVGALRLAFL